VLSGFRVRIMVWTGMMIITSSPSDDHHDNDAVYLVDPLE